MSQKNNDLKIELLKGMTFLRTIKSDEPEEQGSSQEEEIQRITVSKKHVKPLTTALTTVAELIGCHPTKQKVARFNSQ